jgi:RNA polymerase sigma-70 factor, ECF subfamily
MHHELLDFDQVYGEYGPRLYRFCFRLTGSRNDAEDLTQDVLIAAFKGRKGFRAKASVQTWLFRIAVYKSRKAIASRSRDLSLVAELQEKPWGHDAKIDLDRAIGALPPKLREAFVLVKAEQLTAKEAGAILGIPEGTVKYHVFEATQQLRVALKDHFFSSQEVTEHAV